MTPLKILIVLTSHAQLGNTDHTTGFWLEEFTTPYYAFLDGGAEITLASPKGGQPPIDPRSQEEPAQTDSTRRYQDDPDLQARLGNTHKLAELNSADFDAVFFPGGHGPLWDLAEDPHSIALIETFHHSGKPVAAVCHGPAVFKHPKGADGDALVKGKNVTGFSNSEEAAVELTGIVPFLVEDMLQQQGAHYQKGEDWQSHVVVDGLLVTGQNPASSAATARALLDLLNQS